MDARRWISGTAAAALALGLFAFASNAADATYVGAAKCKMCHLKQHKAWSETKHAKSLEAFKDAKAAEAFAAKVGIEIKGSPDKTDECVACHVTGHKKAGGYPQEDAAKLAAVAAVGCESCHGPGSTHVAAPKAEKKGTIKLGSAEACTGCHTEKTSPKFDFETAKKTVHAVAAAAPAPAK